MFRSAQAFAIVMILVTGHAAAEEVPIRLTAGPVATSAMTDAVLRADKALFTAVFDTCDVDAVAALVTDDMEFFHDKGGLVTTSGAGFIESIRGKCERQRTGADFLSRRELVDDTVRVYPLNNYGAIEIGEHRFYALREGHPDQLTESARFTHVWHEDHGAWRLARVLSYDHVLAPRPASADNE